MPIGGYLGAGKTTTMLEAGKRLEAAGERVAVITNDQGADLVDTALSRDAGIAGVGEVTGGCFCCKFEDLTATIDRLEADVRPTVVLAEAVGSCTDLQATVVRPLQKIHGDRLTVAPLTVVVDPIRYMLMSQFWRPEMGQEPDLAYLYRHQLDEADILAPSKIDITPPDVLTAVCADLRKRFPHAAVSPFSSRTGAGLEAIMAQWAATGGRRAFDIDYDRYGAAEAELAWTNQVFTVRAVHGTFVPTSWARTFLEALREGTDGGTLLGHVKIRLVTSGGTTKASMTHAPGEIGFDAEQSSPADHAEVVLNARVRIAPGPLDALIAESLQAADAAAGTESSIRRGDVFQPGVPVPTHRM
ncbi:GTP-binding protein [Pendulispora rubella]|uniref:GTP-binding protein n=1 Tax=Pendulispora rubella TaxID=2741070 RepID=UPI0030E2C50F